MNELLYFILPIAFLLAAIYVLTFSVRPAHNCITDLQI